MAEEQLEQKAEERADKWIKESIDKISLTYWLSYKLGYIDGATEETKELQEIINRIISWAEAVRPREYLHDIIIDAKKLINKDEGK